MTARRASLRHYSSSLLLSLLLLQQAAGPERIDSTADANAPQPNVVETDGAQSSGPK